MDAQVTEAIVVTPAFRALSALLCYPTEEARAEFPEVEAAILAGSLVDAESRRALRPLVDELRSLDLFDLQERYVGLFDRNRRLSLNMFEHVHGESRHRGQSMVDLAALYEEAGLDLAAKELPDYLPLFLEFLATRPLEEARGLLSDAAPALTALESRLAERESPYAAVFAAIRSMVGEARPLPKLEPEEPDDLAALDAAWEEEAVRFGPGAAKDDCAVDRLRTRVRAERRDARTLKV
jgi:nitrate reductase delta subunit